MTSKTPLTGCQVGLPDSCTPMKLKGLWPHVPSLGQTRDQLECRLPWQSPRSIGLCDSSWDLWCCDSSAQTSADGPPGFFLSPSASVGFKWAIPGTVIHYGAWFGSWFFARKPGSGKRDTTSCRWVFPLENTHLPGATLNACRYECRLAEANANRNTHFMSAILGEWHHPRIPRQHRSPSDANGGLSNDNSTRWRFHLAIIMILLCTGRFSRKALKSSLMCGSAAGSYTQWRSTEATDVRCDIIVDGRSLSLKRCII